MSLLSPPVLSALTPDNGLGSASVLKHVDARIPKGFKVPGSTDGSNPLYDRNLSAADRLAGAHEFFTKYYHNRRDEIEIIAGHASKIAALEDLKSVLEFVVALRTNGAEVLKTIDVQALMCANMVGADAKIFGGRDIGPVPALPDKIVDILRSRCELANDGRAVAETHRLVLIPATIDGVPTSINSLRKFAEVVAQGREPAVRDRDWFARAEFANRAVPEGKWVLMYGTMAPNSGSKTDAEQIEAIKGYNQYETAGALEAIGTLVLGYLEHQRRDFSDVLARTEDRAALGARVAVGGFNSDGLFVNIFDGQFSDSDFGRAVCRKFS